MTKKKTVTPVITGIHPTERKKKLLPLHYHPDAIRENCKNLVTMSEKEVSLRILFEDISTLVNWALDPANGGSAKRRRDAAQGSHIPNRTKVKKGIAKIIQFFVSQKIGGISAPFFSCSFGFPFASASMASCCPKGFPSLLPE